MAEIRIRNKSQLANVNNMRLGFKYVAEAFSGLESDLNLVLQKAGLSASSTPSAPPSIQSVTVSASNGVADVAIADNNSLYRAIDYYVEYSTDPAFGIASTHIVPLGSARNVRIPIFLGATSVYFRAYSQYKDGPSSTPVNFGGTTPAGIATGGSGPALGTGQLAGTATQTGQGSGPEMNRINSDISPTL